MLEIIDVYSFNKISMIKYLLLSLILNKTTDYYIINGKNLSIKFFSILE